jgi:hypothetical protein
MIDIAVVAGAMHAACPWAKLPTPNGGGLDLAAEQEA